MSEYYQRVFKECELYMGDRAKRFLDRQIESHLSKNAEEVDYPDGETLAKWVQISSGLILGATKAQILSAKIRAIKPN